MNIQGKEGKLVRDLIPSIIRKDTGEEPEYFSLTLREYHGALLEKLEEEVTELKEAIGAKTREGIAGEFADVYDVLQALALLHGLDPEDMRHVRAAKERVRGGFKRKLFLVSKKT